MNQPTANIEADPKAGFETGWTPARLSVLLGFVALAAAFLMPAVVAWDDKRAFEKWEAREPVKVWIFTASKGEFVPPSEKGDMGPCVMLFMMGVTLVAGAAIAIGGGAVIDGPEKVQAMFGILAGIAGALLAAWLSPAGLIVLAYIAGAFLIAAIIPGIGAFGGGGC